MDISYFFYPLLFLVAFLYAAVGHGGASGYLALMALFSFSVEVMKPTALLLNLFVSLTSFLQFYRGGYFKPKLFWPLAMASIPFAFLGGLIRIDATLYKQLLGIFLLIPVARFIFFTHIQADTVRKANMPLLVLMGGFIGWLSGLIGIGGGIILSPLLLLLGWANIRQSAAISALFIFVNSLSGLAGQLTKGVHFTPDMYLYVMVAFAGGFCGAYFGSVKFKQPVLQYLLAAVLLVAVYKLLFTNA